MLESNGLTVFILSVIKVNVGPVMLLGQQKPLETELVLPLMVPSIKFYLLSILYHVTGINKVVVEVI